MHQASHERSCLSLTTAAQVDKSVLQCTKGDAAEVLAREGLKVVTGTFTIGGQSHFTMEKHTTVAVPSEQGRMILHASTQAPDIARQFISAVLGCPPHKVEVNVSRLGGGFGSRCSTHASYPLSCSSFTLFTFVALLACNRQLVDF